MADIREDLPLPTDPTTIVNLPAIYRRLEHNGNWTVCELRKTLCFNLIYQKRGAHEELWFKFKLSQQFKEKRKNNL